MNTTRLLLISMVCFASFLRTDSCQRVVLSGAAGVSYAEKQRILSMHNSLRQAIAMGQVKGQPPAGNMEEMQWDEELAQRAQKWAMSCYSEEHDPNRGSSRFHVGQNIATFWTTRKPSSPYDMAPEFAKALNGWFKEVSFYHYGKISGYGGTGHYTQLMWAGTNLVGCGYAFYYDPSKGYTKNYICNYGPSGNIISKLPYEKGYPQCTNFGLNYSNKWEGLCTKPTRDTSDYYNYIG